MTLFEAGVIAGVPSGAFVGGVVGSSFGPLGLAGGTVAGMIAGGVAGWGFAFVVIAVGAVMSALWQAACKRPETPLTEEDLRKLTRLTVPGILVALPLGALVAVIVGWLQGLVLMATIAFAFTFIAVARVQRCRKVSL